MLKRLSLPLALLALLATGISRADTANVALNTAPTASAALYGNASLLKLVDGDKTGVFHGDADLPLDFAYTVDLGKDYPITDIKIYPRQDGCCPERLSNFRVSVHQDNAGTMGTEVWGTDQFTDGSNPGSGAGKVLDIPLPSPQTGRWIEVRSLEPVKVPDYSLQMTEMEVFANVPASEVNRATVGVASANQPLWPGTTAANLIDGNHMTYAHGIAGLQPGFAYTINLGVEVDMSKIIIIPRQDGNNPERLSNYRVAVYTDNAGAPGTKVWSVDLHTDLSNIGADLGAQEVITKDLNPTGTFKGQYVKIESLDDPVPDYSLQIGEVEVYGTPAAGTKVLINQDLQDVPVGAGQPATFSIGVSVINGDTNLLSFQWQRDGTNILNATNTTYTTGPILSSDAGAKYKVVISYPGLANVISKEAAANVNYAYHAAAYNNEPLWKGAAWTIDKLVNGDRGDVFHGDVDIQPGFAYQVKLASPVKFDSIDIYPRQDGCCPDRLTNFRVSIHNDDNGTNGPAVWTADFFTDGSNPGANAGGVIHIVATNDPAGTFQGQWIQILSLDDAPSNYALQMTELEAYGTLLESQPKLSIVTFPDSLLGVPGRTGIVSVVANIFNGDPANLTYTWKKNGTVVATGTNSTYSTLLQDSDAGAKFRVVVSYPGLADVESSDATVVFDYNYARGSAAYNNQPLWIPGGWDIGKLVDGDTRGVFHGDTGLQPGFAYMVNLGDVINLEKINIYPRQDSCCPERLTNFRVSVHLDNNGQIGQQVWSVDLFTDGTNPESGLGSVLTITNEMGGGTFKGQWIKITSLEDPVQNYALQMTELEAIGKIDTSGQLKLNFDTSGGNLTLSWTDGVLESVDDLGGTWAAVIGATNPYPVQKTKPHTYYRLKK